MPVDNVSTVVMTEVEDAKEMGWVVVVVGGVCLCVFFFVFDGFVCF